MSASTVAASRVGISARTAAWAGIVLGVLGAYVALPPLMIRTPVVSLLLAVLVIFNAELWPIPTLIFITGWILQFVGHAFERKAPEFFKDWRFLLVGTRWWVAKVRGRA